MATAAAPAGLVTRTRAGRAGLREALRSLTLRGRSFVAAGLTAVLCGIVLGERDLVRIGVLVVLLPVVAAAWVARSGNRLGLVRGLAASQVEAGQQTMVHLELTNVGATTGLLLVEEQVPWALGSPPRFVVDTLRPGWRRRIDYPVRTELRGRYQIGPLRVRIGDPLGLVELHRTFTRTSSLTVIPRAERLPGIRMHGSWSASGDDRPRPFATGSAADVTVRDYRRGDDLRRVHWRSTARVGGLMVRREEQPWQSRATVLIDNRARAHRGHGPDSSLERAVSAAASVAVHLVRQGFQVRLVSAVGDEVEHGWHDGEHGVSAAPLLERLAVLPSVAVPDLRLDWSDESLGGGVLVAILGSLDEHDRGLLGRLHRPGGASYALVIDVDDWGSRAGRVPSPDVPATAWLHQRGWKAAALPRGGSVAAAWQELGR